MNLFRNLLFWIALILLGALVAQLFVQDPGYVLVRYGNGPKGLMVAEIRPDGWGEAPSSH